MDAAIVSFAYPEDYVVSPRDCVGSSCVWGLAAQLMTHGHSGFAFDICFYLSRVKSVIKFILK